jgi:hypothetical protein
VAVREGDENRGGGGYTPVDLARSLNAGLDTLYGHRAPVVGEVSFHGVPFSIGPAAPRSGPYFVRLDPGAEPVTVQIDERADRVLIAHRRLRTREIEDDLVIGDEAGRYVFAHGGAGLLESVLIRERLEIAVAPDEGFDASGPFLAGSSSQIHLPERFEGPWEMLGARQCEAAYDWLPDYFIYVWRHPFPDSPLTTIELSATGAPILVAAITLGSLGEDPFPMEAARTIRFSARRTSGARPVLFPAVEVDRGASSYAFPLPSKDLETYLADPLKGWGERPDPDGSSAYARVTATPSAEVVLRDGTEELGRFRWGELDFDRPVETDTVRVEVVEQGRNWVHVTVEDADTSLPVPCRVHFRSLEGVPYPPHGHHAHVNSDLGTWHVDVGGDLRLGRTTYAYIDGTCQGWLPRGDIIVDVARGFEYEPIRELVHIDRGRRDLTLRIKRWRSMNHRGWYSGDSHAHFLSASGSVLEQQGEDLNVVNLLQSQWGSLFTNTEDFTGRPIASPDGRYVTMVSQENRQPFHGHLALWGLRRPIMPWCSDGPNEAEFGGWLETTLSDWADRCHEQDGTVIIAHFPLPNGEPAVLIATGRADAIEMITQRRSFHHEYYGYLNDGYRLPLVGGTDKMSADVPVGAYRTYAYLGDREFRFDRWCAAVRAGRTFLSGGPILDLEVEGSSIGDTVRIPGGGVVAVRAWAESVFPSGPLQLVLNGRVIASTDDRSGGRRVELRTDVRVDSDGWLAARCGGPDYWDGPSYPGPWERGIFAHSSPIYVSCGDGEWSRFDASHARMMRTLVDAGLERVRTRRRAYPEDRITHHHGQPDHLAFLERPFLEARDAIARRIEEAVRVDTRRHR